MDSKLLEKIGLTSYESKIYLALLELGTAKTGAILKKSNLNSGKIYELLDGLKKKGLISESIINNVKHFTASPPSELLKYMEQKKQTLLEEESSLKEIIPQMQSLHHQVLPEPRSVVYTDIQGFKTAVNEATSQLKSGDEVLSMGITNIKNPKISEFWRIWSQKNLSKKITAKYLFSDEGSHHEKTKKLPFVQTKIAKGKTPVAVDIYGKKTVVIIQYNNPIYCILIQDENTATSFRTFFYQLWEKAK